MSGQLQNLLIKYFAVALIFSQIITPYILENLNLSLTPQNLKGESVDS